MTTIPSLSDVTDILDTDLVMVTNSQGQSYKIAGSELNKRHKVIIASSTTVTGAPLRAGWPVRIYFTADITAANATTTMQINYNNVNYYVKVPKNGALANYVAFNLGGSPAVFKYVQAYTTLELLFDGTQFIIMCNPVVISGTNFSIYADGLKRVDEVTENGTDLVTSHAVAAAIDKVKDIMSSLPTDEVLHYSFDEVPDYPDGTADYFRNKNFTSLEAWQGQGGSELSIENNGLKIKSTSSSNNFIQAVNDSLTASNISNKVIKIKYRANQKPSFRLQDYGGSYTAHLFDSQSLGNGQYEVLAITGTYSYNQMFTFLFTSASTDNYVIIDGIYIGNGSYTTPIIDNANGQNNATNSGGIAVKGVSGKGIRFLGNGVAFLKEDIGEKNKSFSCWFSIDNTVPAGCIFCKNYNGFIVQVRNINNVNTLGIFYYSAGWTNIIQITANTVYHLVVICGETNIKIYLNGVLVTTINVTVINNINRLYIGALASNASNGLYGIVDDLLIFDRALTENEVMALYLNRGNTPKYYPPAQLPS